MDIGDQLFSPGGALDEQIAKAIFDILPERGPIMVIMDRDGNCWSNNFEKFSKLNLDESFLRQFCTRVDDGVEPVMTEANDCSIIAAQLATERTNCGYVIIALPQYSSESTLANIGLIETLLSQIGLVARLIEQNNLLRELQMKQLSLYTQNEISSN